MTKKERTIKACRELAAKYREPKGETFFCDEHCPLCSIHYFPNRGVCFGCPLAKQYSTVGCSHFSTYQSANKVSAPPEAFNARAAFFDKIIPILEKIPASRFTKRGWEYFDMLDRSW